ncbi:hypothetical protein VULLAG_LOCUS18975 [Vulpes lagopus]
MGASREGGEAGSAAGGPANGRAPHIPGSGAPPRPLGVPAGRARGHARLRVAREGCPLARREGARGPGPARGSAGSHCGVGSGARRRRGAAAGASWQPRGMLRREEAERAPRPGPRPQPGRGPGHRTSRWIN